MGGALLREKMVAQKTKTFIIVADAGKRVGTMGTKSPLPVEVTQWSHQTHMKFLESLGCVPVLRTNADGSPFVTDCGNYIFNCDFRPNGFDDPAKLQWRIDLMRMQSGLRWNEDYGSISDVTQMLYCHGDFARYAIKKPLEYPIGSRWAYSSGSSNIVCYWARQHFKSDSAFYAFIYGKLLNRIGLQDAILEPDASGIPVGSSYIYATARDYARFALLYLQDGVFNGQSILPKGWVNYTRTPTRNSEGAYGAFFWRKGKESSPELPNDFYSCEGHDGQYVIIIPSRQLAIVVLGYSHRPNNTLKLGLLVKDVLGAVG